MAISGKEGDALPRLRNGVSDGEDALPRPLSRGAEGGCGDAARGGMGVPGQPGAVGRGG